MYAKPRCLGRVVDNCSGARVCRIASVGLFMLSVASHSRSRRPTGSAQSIFLFCRLVCDSKIMIVAIQASGHAVASLAGR